MDSRPLIRRWFAFNAVGVGGFAVQLAVLVAALHVLQLHYLIAAVVAVEAAVLHNFYWHNRWTWRDRPAGGARELAARLWRFQILNGAISLGGTALFMTLLTGGLGVNPVAANVVAIAGCALVNFAASESLVFARTAPLFAGMLLLGAPSVAAAGPSPATLQAWNAYASSIDARYAAQTSGAAFFMQDIAARTPGWRDVVQRGEVHTVRFDAPSVPDGRIHHWAGAVFIPRTTVTQVVDRLLQQAGRESRFYEDVVDSRLLAREGDRVRVFMKLRRTTILTATFNTEHTVEYRRLGPARASSRSVSTRIVELAEAGTPAEHERAADDDRGFLWRLNAYWRFEETAGGVIVECESLSLSRGVPALVRPVANPLIDRVARESLETTLRGLKAFLQAGA
jgi:putative flippase GtrA